MQISVQCPIPISFQLILFFHMTHLFAISRNILSQSLRYASGVKWHFLTLFLKTKTYLKALSFWEILTAFNTTKLGINNMRPIWSDQRWKETRCQVCIRWYGCMVIICIVGAQSGKGLNDLVELVSGDWKGKSFYTQFSFFSFSASNFLTSFAR